MPIKYTAEADRKVKNGSGTAAVNEIAKMQDKTTQKE